MVLKLRKTERRGFCEFVRLQRETERAGERERDRQTDRQTNRQTNTYTEREGESARGTRERAAYIQNNPKKDWSGSVLLRRVLEQFHS